MADVLFMVGFFNNPALVDGEENHVTVLQNFSVPDQNMEKFLTLTEETLAGQESFSITPEGEANLSGYDTVLIRHNPELIELHRNLCTTVTVCDGVLNRFSRQHYKPHVTGWVSPATAKVTELTLVHHAGGLMNDIRILRTYPLVNPGSVFHA
tara:strand:- start:29 stop:487 length:459 start_codon:yes stop_codon:yes gene_type:complete